MKELIAEFEKKVTEMAQELLEKTGANRVTAHILMTEHQCECNAELGFYHLTSYEKANGKG